MAYPWSARARVEYNGQITLHFKDTPAHGVINAAPSAPSLINNHAQVEDGDVSNNNNDNNNNSNGRRHRGDSPDVAHDGNAPHDGTGGSDSGSGSDSSDNTPSSSTPAKEHFRPHVLWTLAEWFFVIGSLGNPPCRLES